MEVGWSVLVVAIYKVSIFETPHPFVNTTTSDCTDTSVHPCVKLTVAKWCAAGVERIKDMETLNSEQRSVGWGLGATLQQQLSRQATTPALMRLYQLLLFTMPGTPVFTYGDEIGLQAGQVNYKTCEVFLWACSCRRGVTFCLSPPTPPLFLFPDQGSDAPRMVWDTMEEPAEGAAVNETAQVRVTCRCGVLGQTCKNWHSPLPPPNK